MSEDCRAESNSDSDSEKSVNERDRDWLANVYRGDKEADLTVRVLAGMAFGGLMSLSNLYVGLKSGWGLGVDIAAVIVIFSVCKALHGIGIMRREFGLMETTMTMTVAVAASWISSAGLVSAVPALTLLTGYQFVPWQLTLFIAVILYLGVFMAIPFKRQMIQVDSLRFPANIPTGETLLVMYSQGSEALRKAAALGVAGLLGMIVAGLRDGLGWIPGQLYFPWRLHRIALAKLTLSVEPSLIFVSIGALFGMKVGLSMLLGLVVNYGVIAPRLIENHVITHEPPAIKAADAPQLPMTFKTGQTFAVRIEEPLGEPELPTADTIAANPKLAISMRDMAYTWKRPTTYTDLAGLMHDLNAATLDDGSPNPLHDVIAVGTAVKKGHDVTVLDLKAPAAKYDEAKLVLPGDQLETLHLLGFKSAEDVEEAKAKLSKADGKEARRELEKAVADAEKALAAQNEKALRKVGGFRSISAWSLWPGATVLVVGGLLALAFQWRTLGRTFVSIFRGLGTSRDAARGSLDHVEIPMNWFVGGFVSVGILAVLLLSLIFSIHWWMGAIAVLLTFFLAAVASRAGAEIGINPIGALGKVTQLTYGALAPGNISANLMTAGLTAGAACSCSDTIGNLKVGHMVGANPRKQFFAQLFGVLAGALLAVPAYFVLVPDAEALGGDKFPAPSALVWMGVAKVLSQGLRTLPPGAVTAMIVAFAVGVIIVIVDHVFPKARPYTPSPAALGIAMTIPAFTSFAMFLGALIAWILEKNAPKWNAMYTIPIASGCIAGESIMGVILAVLMAAGLMR